jgi:hypothetical protein
VPTDDSAHQPFDAHVVQALGFAVPLRRGIKKGEVPGASSPQKAFLEPDDDFFREACSNETFRRYNITVSYETDGFLC